MFEPDSAHAPQPWGEDGPVSRASPLSIEPLYVKTLPESNQLRSAIVSTDGASIYAVVEVPVIDVGRLLNMYSLAWVGACSLVLTLALLAWARRASRRRRTVGALHCRRCDYDVTSIAAPAGAAKCPECGADLRVRTPLPGRRAIRQLALPLALLAAVVVGYGVFVVASRQRPRQIVPVGAWGSRLLSDWSSRTGFQWLSKAATRGDLLLELDAETGETRRTIATRATQTFWEMEYNPAAKGVYLSGPGGGVDLIDVTSGRVRASFTKRRVEFNPSQAPGIAGHSEDFGLVYLNGMDDQRDARATLTEWNWRTGATRDIAADDGYTRKDVAQSYARHFTVIPGSPVRFALFPDFMESYEAKAFGVKIFDADGRVTVERDLGPTISPHAVPAFSRDGSTMFLVHGFGEAVGGYDPATLELTGRLLIADSAGATSRAHVHCGGRLMLVPGIQTILVRDIVDRKWVARLTHPRAAYGPRSVGISDNGQIVCAVFQSNGPSGSGGGGFYFQLGVWRLPPSITDRAPAAGSN